MATRSEEYVFKAKEFVNLVAKELQSPDDVQHASDVTLSSFGTLRELLSPEESLHLIAQLPLYVKAAYVNGWHLDEEGKSLSKKSTLPAPSDFHAFLSVLGKYISEGEMHHVITQLPEEFKPKHLLC
jgi:uncharacterized protein (DUF2267 family)